MIIDLILNRRTGTPYRTRAFYKDVVNYGEIGHDIASALDGGEEQDVKAALCAYIEEHNYNEKIKDYINSVQWLDE